MLINEAGRRAKLTKKAIEYYMEQGLIHPEVLENGYRDFSQADVERLLRISVLRRLGLGIEEIKAVFTDETGDALARVSIRRELGFQKEQAKKAILDKLCAGASYLEINAELEAVERSAAVAQRLLEAFPGYYGRFICLHFARFLHEPVITEDQRKAYDVIVAFLDNAPALVFPDDLRAFLDETTKSFRIEVIKEILENTKQAIGNPESFLSENRGAIEQYLEYKQSDEYKNSPLNRLQALLKEFNRASGYYDHFIPAMKALSASYAAYSRQMEIANEQLLLQYPDIERQTASQVLEE